MFSRLLGRPSKTSQIAPRLARLKSRLGCEMLEARDVPTALYWNPQSYTADPHVSVANNWTDSNNVRRTNPPTAADDLFFLGYGSPGPGYSNSNAIIDSSSGGTFHGIHLVNYYAGTVSLQVATTVDTFEQRYGSIAQSGGGLDLFVTNAFTLTGGTLNNTSTLGTVHLRGATGVIQPTYGGPDVEVGSTLSLESRNGIGTTLTQLPGTEWTTNGAGMDIYANCGYELPEQPGAGPVVVQQRVGKNTAKGILRIYLLGYENVDQSVIDDRAIWVQGGSLNVTHDATITGLLDPSRNDSPSIQMDSGTIRLKNGTRLTTPGILMGGGLFVTTPGATGSTVAIIDGLFAVTGGGIILGFEIGQQHVFSDLRVTNDFVMAGGTFFAGVDGTANSIKSDRILTDKQMTLRAGAKVSVQVFNPPQGGVSGRAWQVFEATGGIVTNDFTTDDGWTTTIDQPKKRIFVWKN